METALTKTLPLAPERPTPAPPAAPALRALARAAAGPARSLHQRLLCAAPSEQSRAAAAAFIEEQLRAVAQDAADLPASPDDLIAWMEQSTTQAFEAYAHYMAGREQGEPRRYFRNRAHALHFLRAVAPTKLVDGAWLAGLVRHGDNPRLAPLIRTYFEELGDGDPAKNHVLLYRQLLGSLGLQQEQPESDAAWTQGAIQLALGCQAEAYLPEIIGFNLGYEQLPLHLLITAYELDELGIDPYYFTLHITVDNAATGHARQACDAVLQLLPRHEDAGEFWRRVREGSKLGCVGLGTQEAIEGFDIDAEVVRIFTAKAPLGAGAHANHCRVAGRSVNDWLREPGGMGAFLAQLEKSGWIVRGAPAADSRFWHLLQGERAQMFGVFSPYELQVIHDWLRGAESADGLSYLEQPSANQSTRRPRFRVAQRVAAQRAGVAPVDPATWLDPDLEGFIARLRSLDPQARRRCLVQATAPSEHWTPAGLYATRCLAAEMY